MQYIARLYPTMASWEMGWSLVYLFALSASFFSLSLFPQRARGYVRGVLSILLGVAPLLCPGGARCMAHFFDCLSAAVQDIPPTLEMVFHPS
jgi:quinol-cytochrome oxidoreductase complex cytochrome b subunit